MNKIYLKASLPLMALLALSGCVDDKYDLDNINTESEIKVNNLVIPVNLDKITLDQLLDIDDNDPDATVVTYRGDDGKTYYAIRKNGAFQANDVYINKVYASAPSGLSPMSVNISVPSGSFSGSIPVPEMLTSFNYEVNDVDEAIVSIKNFELSPSNSLHLSLNFSSSTLQSFSMSEVVVKLPKGFQAYYNGNTPDADGLLNIGSISNNDPIDIDITGLDLTMTYPETDGLVNEQGHISIYGEVGLASAQLSNISTSSNNLELSMSVTMSSFIVDSYSGEINYHVMAPAFEPVTLNDLPDFLAGEDTDITLYNPQIYLSVNNGVGDYGLYAYSGLEIRPIRDDEFSGSPLTLDEFTIGKNSADGYYNLVMAPYPYEATLAEQYTSLNYFAYPGLEKVLSGKGLPQQIDFTLFDPVVKGATEYFPLGSSLSFNGEYTFFTPLQFEAGSNIQYVKDENDWFDGDVDKMHLKDFILEANASTNLPFDITLNAYPYTKDYHTGVSTLRKDIKASTTIRANAQSEPIKLTFDTEIEGLNGIYFEANIYTQEEETLNSDQYIMLENIRATVNGSYITKF